MNFDNTYTLRVEEIGGITYYFVSFKDGQGIERETEVSRFVYLEFQDFVKQERNQQRWRERHIEQSELSDEHLLRRSLSAPKPVEDTVLDNLRDKQLARAILELPEVQRRRFVLYHDFELTSTQIANIEGCSNRAVRYSLTLAIG